VRGSRAWCDIALVLIYRWPFGAFRRAQAAGQAVAQDGVLSMKRARERSRGEITSENDDMSSDKECERHSRRKSKGSCLKLI